MRHPKIGDELMQQISHSAESHSPHQQTVHMRQTA
jgi:hypothetical protein